MKPQFSNPAVTRSREMRYVLTFTLMMVMAAVPLVKLKLAIPVLEQEMVRVSLMLVVEEPLVETNR